MTTTLLVTLALSVPLAILAWIGALVVDRTGAGLRVRRAVWTLAFIVPLVLAPMALTVSALGWSVRPASPATIQIAAPGALDGAGSGSLVAYDASPLDQGPNWAVILLTLIVLGAVIKLSVLAWQGLSLSRIARRAESLAGDFGGRTVRLHDGEAPVLVGLFRPVVLMPRNLASRLTPAEITLICAHERAHVRAGDHIANLLEAIAMAIFWFNPALGAIRAGLSAVREEACDAAALTGAEKPTRRVYAEVLLAAIRHAGAAEPAVAFTGFYRARSARRLRAILTPQGKGAKTAVALAAGIGLIVAGTAGGLAFAFAGSQPSAAPLARPIPLPAERAAQAAAPAIAKPPVIQLAAVEAPKTSAPPRPAPAAGRARPSLADLDTMNALRKLLVDTRLAKVEAEARLNALDALPIETWPEVRRDADIRQLNKQIQEITTRDEAISNRQPPGGAQRMVNARQIERLQRERQKQAELVRGDMETELRVMEAKEVAIREQLAAMSAAMMAADMARSAPALP